MLFEYKFQIIEIRENGVSITHHLQGRKRDVKRDIETYKKNTKRYQMVGKKGMIVWA